MRFPEKVTETLFFFYLFFYLSETLPTRWRSSHTTSKLNLSLFSLSLSLSPKRLKPKTLKKRKTTTFFFGLNPFFYDLYIFWWLFHRPNRYYALFLNRLAHSLEDQVPPRHARHACCNPSPDLTTWRWVYSHMSPGLRQWDVYMSKH